MGLDIRLLPFSLTAAEQSTEVIRTLCSMFVERQRELYYFLLGGSFVRAPGDWVFDEVEHVVLEGSVLEHEKTLYYAKPEDFLELDTSGWPGRDRAVLERIRKLTPDCRVLIEHCH